MCICPGKWDDDGVIDPVEPGVETNVRPLRDTLSQLRLRELLMEVQDRVEQIVEGRDRLDGLLDAMLVVTSGLELDETVRTSCTPPSNWSTPATERWAYAARTTS